MTIMTADAKIPQDGDQFELFLITMSTRLDFATRGKVPLFTTSTEGLYDTFLDYLPLERRQHYNCRSCRRFIERFGGLALISEFGSQDSLLWEHAKDFPSFFRKPVQEMRGSVRRAKVTGVFLSEDKVWGTVSNTTNKPPYVWTHMAITPGRDLVFKKVLLDAGQVMAEKLEEYNMLSRGLAEFPLALVEQAHTLLSSGHLYRSEKCLGVAKFLLDLQRARHNSQNRQALDNLLWHAAAMAPAGFCHVKSGMIGTLLEDIQMGLPFADIQQRFAEKMAPGHYQRPQSPPKAGNILVAEKIVAKLGAENAFLRRFARLEDLQLLWSPRPQKPVKLAIRGMFSHLQPGPTPAQQMQQPPITMTWAKFQREALPRAEEIEFLVPTEDDSFVGLVTATNAKAPPILVWDRDDRRNPVSWYFYLKGSPASRWGLRPHTFHRVSGITLQPSMWYQEDAFPQHGKKVFFLLDGAKDLQHGGIGFFPEMLRSEYHEIRKTVEAHMHSTSITDNGKPTACGIGLQAGVNWKYTFRVTANGAKLTYILDRWD